MSIEDKIAKRVEGFENLSSTDCAEIILAAKSLSLDECYDFLLIDSVSLSDEERSFAELLHRRGRAIGVKDASDKLFTHMTTRNGGQSALEYLKQMSGEFSVEVTSSANKGFQFNINIPEVDAKANPASVSKT